MKRTALLLAVLLVTATVPASALAGSTEGDAYAGSNVAFDTRSTAVVDYAVDGNQTFESVRVQSQSALDSQLGLSGSADLEAASRMTGAAVSFDAESDASASMTTESGATIEAHDNGHGTLVVTASDESQYVALNTSQSAAVEQESEDRVVFTTESGAKASAMVVGEGSVTATGDGNVTASLSPIASRVLTHESGTRQRPVATE